MQSHIVFYSTLHKNVCELVVMALVKGVKLQSGLVNASLGIVLIANYTDS